MYSNTDFFCEHSFTMNLDMRILCVKTLIFLLWTTLVQTQETTPSTRPVCTQSLMVALKSIFEANADAECVSFLKMLQSFEILTCVN